VKILYLLNMDISIQYSFESEVETRFLDID